MPKMVIPALYSTVELKLERVVDLGPFKHKVMLLNIFLGCTLRGRGGCTS